MKVRQFSALGAAKSQFMGVSPVRFMAIFRFTVCVPFYLAVFRVIRPLTLLNCDYKIATKAIANRRPNRFY